MYNVAAMILETHTFIVCNGCIIDFLEAADT